MRIFSFLVLFLAISFQTVFAQPVLHGGSEIRLNETPVHMDYRKPAIAVGDSGKFWVAWPGGSQWMDFQMNPIGSNSVDFGYSQSILHLENDVWCVLSRSDSIYSDSSGTAIKKFYRFSTIENERISDSISLPLVLTDWSPHGSTDSFRSEIILSEDVYTYEDTVYITWSVIGGSEEDELNQEWSRRLLSEWDWLDRNPEIVIDQEVRGKSLDISIRYDRNLMLFCKPHESIAPIYKPSTATLYSRVSLNGSVPFMIRQVRRIDLTTGELSPTMILDTISSFGVNASDYALARSDGGFDLLQYDINTATLFSETFDSNGRYLGKTEIISNLNALLGGEPGSGPFEHGPFYRPASLSPEDIIRITADYQVIRFSNGYGTDYTVFIWSQFEEDSTTNIYAAVWDESWNPVNNTPIRLNSVEDGDQYYPRLETGNGYMYVAWCDTRQSHDINYPDVFFRRFALWEIMPSTRVEDFQPQSFSASLYPNPASPASGHVSINLNSDRYGIVNVTVFDILGRVRYQDQYDVRIGSNTCSIDITNFPAGVYNLVFDNGQSIHSQQLVVR